MGKIESNEASEKKGEGGGFSKNNILVGLLAVLVLVVAFNQYQIATLSALPIPKEVVTVAVPVPAAAAATQQGGSQAAQIAQQPRPAAGAGVALSSANVLPSGVPAIYGAELGIKYDDISANNPGTTDATINKLASLDQSINLEGEQLGRYIGIASSIACEYCCGAQSLVFSNGQPACGCAHSYAMRGVAKYLIKNHGSEFSDEQILEELGKWKVLFFPGVHAQKAAALEGQGIPLNYINLASNKYRGAEKGATGGGGSMVGGC